MATGTPFIPGPREYRVGVPGDSTQQRNLVALCGPRRQERLHIHVRAQLVLQDEDPQVQVSIQDRPMGHLSPAAADALHRIVRYGERSPHEAFECAALITGISGRLRVQLDLPIGD